MQSFKLNQIASNMTLVETPHHRVLFSYATPVACFDKHTYDYFKTDRKWSQTTTRHINKWLDGVHANEKPQAYFDNLFNGQGV